MIHFASLLIASLAAGALNGAEVHTELKSRATLPGKDERCWKNGTTELENPHGGERKPPPLPAHLKNEKVKRSVILLKLCVTDRGAVERVLLLVSSGNTKVDDFYRETLSKWTFKPMTTSGRARRSVMKVAVTLYLVP